MLTVPSHLVPPVTLTEPSNASFLLNCPVPNAKINTSPSSLVANSRIKPEQLLTTPAANRQKHIPNCYELDAITSPTSDPGSDPASDRDPQRQAHFDAPPIVHQNSAPISGNPIINHQLNPIRKPVQQPSTTRHTTHLPVTNPQSSTAGKTLERSINAAPTTAQSITKHRTAPEPFHQPVHHHRSASPSHIRKGSFAAQKPITNAKQESQVQPPMRDRAQAVRNTTQRTQISLPNARGYAVSIRPKPVTQVGPTYKPLIAPNPAPQTSLARNRHQPIRVPMKLLPSKRPLDHLGAQPIGDHSSSAAKLPRITLPSSREVPTANTSPIQSAPQRNDQPSIGKLYIPLSDSVINAPAVPQTPEVRLSATRYQQTNYTTYRHVLNIISNCWSVDKLLPAYHIQNRRSRPPPTSTTISLPQRILIGYIDMYRPYCSHMTARDIEFGVGCHSNDVASLSTASDVRVPGLKANEVAVLTTEMGIELRRLVLIRGKSLDESINETLKMQLAPYVRKSSYAWEDRTVMSKMPHVLRKCIDRNEIEVKWELSHHPGAANKDKAFAMEHDFFSNFDTATKESLLKQQLEWLQHCEARFKNAHKLNAKNCCRLRAWVYLAPAAFSSNMVAAANFFPLNALQAHMQPLDGGPSLAEQLRKNHDWEPTRHEKTHPPSTIPSEMEKHRKVFDNIPELTKRDNDSRSLQLVLASIRCHENGFVVPASASNSTKRYSNVLETTTAAGSSSWQSFCRTDREDTERNNLIQSQELTNELLTISTKDEPDSKNKASIRAVLSSSRFTVSDGYSSVAVQPPQIKLPLRRYQRESLAWMLDQEKKRSISDPFWVTIRAFSTQGKTVDVFYCPLTGMISRFAPPPVIGGVLAEEMGLGKTIIAASLIVSTLDEAREMCPRRTGCRTDLTHSHGTLIVCPVSLLKQWEKELQKHVSPPLKVLCWYGSRTTRPDVLASYDVVLTTYGILSAGSHHPLLHILWHRIITDESTYLKGGGIGCHKEYMDLIARRRWAISGTPFGDDFQKFLPTMRFIGVTPFASGHHFQRLALALSTPLEHPKLARSLSVPRFAYVMKNILIRHVKNQRLHGEPLVELPRATGRCVSIILGADEKREYGKLESDVKECASRLLRNQKSFGSHFVQLATMTRPLRIKADGVEPITTQREGRKDETEGKKRMVPVAVPTRRRRVGAKVKQLLNDVRRYRDADSTAKFVVFTEFNPVKEEIKRTLQGNGFGVMTIDGGMTAGRRGTMIKNFAEDADAAALVLSMAAGACGLTLTMANVVVLFEVGLKMAMELQAVNRIHRIGQTRPVVTLTYVAKGTIDERIVEVRKRRGHPGVVGEVTSNNGEEMSTLQVYRKLFAYVE